ncbi:hypothetical protein ACWEQN_47605, partial [Streptomyces sp. NPDC004129]
PPKSPARHQHEYPGADAHQPRDLLLHDAHHSVSQHLARLRLAGLVTTRKEGRRVVYGLRHGHLRRLVAEALSVADHQIGHLPPHD